MWLIINKNMINMFMQFMHIIVLSSLRGGVADVAIQSCKETGLLSFARNDGI